MTFLEKRSIVHMIALLLYMMLCAVLFVQRYPDGISDATTDFRFLAIAVLLLIPVQIVVAIVLHIVFSIVNPEATKKDAPGFEDERDKLIELKSLRNAYQTFLVGFLIAMLVLALGNPLSVMFIVLVLTFFMVQIVWYASQFFFYRRGF